MKETRAHQNIAKFQVRRIRKRNINYGPVEIIELFNHILAAKTLEMHGSIVDFLSITKIYDPRTNQTVLHYLATKPRSFQPVLEIVLQKFDTVDIFDASKIVREAEVILLTFSRDKSILLLNCSLDVQ